MILGLIVGGVIGFIVGCFVGPSVMLLIDYLRNGSRIG